MKRVRVRHGGFTIVELLIVIVVIAVLASITIVAYNGIQQRSRDTRRAQDISNIRKALLSYNAVNGGVQNTNTYSAAGPGGWDNSTQANWLSFLRTQHGPMPVDPINVSSGDPTANVSGSNRVYFYYCYPPGSGLLPASYNVRIGYFKENTDAVNVSFAVDNCI